MLSDPEKEDDLGDIFSPVDPDIQELVVLLRSFPGMTTTSSCSGHGDGPDDVPYVSVVVEGEHGLECFSRFMRVWNIVAGDVEAPGLLEARYIFESTVEGCFDEEDYPGLYPFSIQFLETCGKATLVHFTDAAHKAAYAWNAPAGEGFLPRSITVGA